MRVSRTRQNADKWVHPHSGECSHDMEAPRHESSLDSFPQKA